jgi:hypothetical protein
MSLLLVKRSEVDASQLTSIGYYKERKQFRFLSHSLRCFSSNGVCQVNFMVKPNGRLVLVSFTHYCAFTSSLSNRWSSCALHHPFGLGDLILRSASRLYAFSGYHNRTSLPSHAVGTTAGTQEVRPSRSSRTKDRPSQISYAHTR